MIVAIIVISTNARNDRAIVADAGPSAANTIREYLREVGKRFNATACGLSRLRELARPGLTLDRETNHR